MAQHSIGLTSFHTIIITLPSRLLIAPEDDPKEMICLL